MAWWSGVCRWSKRALGRASEDGFAARLALFACLALGACVEQARSADVVGEVASTHKKVAAAVALPAQIDVGEISVRTPPPPANPEVTSFFGEREDGPLRTALLNGRIQKVEKGKGGRSLGFKLVLDTGEKAYFKADQTFSAANWFGEVASYHLDRMLGIGRVPMVVSRTFPWESLAPAAGKDVRKAEIIVQGTQVQGALVAWVSGGLQPLPHQPGWERWVRVQHWPTSAISPFQRPAVWAQQQANRSMVISKEERTRRRLMRPEPDREDRAAELSDLVLFDYLTRNQDRWGGENANVLIRGAHGPLVFLDNGAAFEPGDPRPSLMEARIHTLQRFRRRTIAAVRAFDIERFRARLAKELIQPVLSEAQIAGLVARRQALLEWVAENEAAHGEAIWAWE
ncbi:MAG: polymerase subunit gamma and tau [Myxococcaceae bacterium]|nr:polymerase subunit gamma and tau [Myxococcaceae bacterium]